MQFLLTQFDFPFSAAVVGCSKTLEMAIHGVPAARASLVACTACTCDQLC
jgi:hypothetical protein